MATLAQLLAEAVRYHQQGALGKAEQLYQQILQADPTHADALHLLGLIAHQVGKHELAVDSISRALRLRPQFAEAYSNLGLALRELGRLDAAIAAYHQALRLRPESAEVHNNLGVALSDQGRLGDAIASFREALRLRPIYAMAHYNLGVALSEQGNHAAAVGQLREALRQAPTLAEAEVGLGIALRAEGNPTEATACFARALRLRPDYAEAHNYLGLLLKEQDKVPEAAEQYRAALRAQPDYAEAHNNLGVALGELGMPEEAVHCYREAIRYKPDYAEAHQNLGMALLLLGRFAEGWSEYAWRWKTAEQQQPRFRKPAWEGASLQGKTILLYAEQGLGDALQFVRYAPLVKARGGCVLLACPPLLAPLLATSPGVDVVIAHGAQLPAFDVHASLLDLPRIFVTTLANVPASVPYLCPNPAGVERWRKELASIHSFRIGIAWQGNPSHRTDRARSVPLTQFAPLAGLEGVKLLSLQKGPGVEQLAALGGRLSVLDLAGPVADTPEGFVELACAVKNLDLVVTVDTAIAHLAGALGVPVWVALPNPADWRWLLGREDSPWYPSMRLFRQQERGNWAPVFERLAEAVRCRVAAVPQASGSD